MIIPSESCPNKGDIRLQNGTNSFEGRVEVCGSRDNVTQRLIWKTVCNAGWDKKETEVVCRQLGFSTMNRKLSFITCCIICSQEISLSAVPVMDGTFRGHPQHINYIIKRNFTCQGDEENLLNCSYHNHNSTYCNESQSMPAGVYCFDPNQGQSYYFSGRSSLE